MGDKSRTYFAGKNILFGYISRIIATILEFVLRYIFICYLGEELLGVNGVFSNIIQVLSLAELGMNNVIGYSLYKPIAVNDERKIVALIRFYKKMYNAVAMVIAGIGILLIPFLKFLINTEIPVDNIYFIYLLFLADTVFSYLFIYKAFLLTANQKGYICIQYNMIAEFLIVILQISVIILFRSLIWFLIVRVIVNVTKNYLLANKADREYSFLNEHENYNLAVDEEKSLISTIKSGFIYKLSSVLLNSTDNIIISWVIGTVFVGYLSNYNTITMGIGTFYTIIFSSLTASIGNLIEKENAERREAVFNIALLVASWMAIVVSVCFFVLSDEFVSLWLGSRFVLDKSVILAKSIILFLSCSLQPVFSYREALGLYRKTKYIMFLAAVVNIVLSIILGYYFSLAGVLFATILSMLLTYYWYEPIVLYKECFEKYSVSYFLRRVVDWAVLGGLLFGASKYSDLYVANTWLKWIVKAIVMFVGTNIVCFLIFFKTKAFTGLKLRLKELVKKVMRHKNNK